MFSLSSNKCVSIKIKRTVLKKLYFFKLSGQSCSYSYISDFSNWTDGRERCMNDGMDLAVIKDQETYDAVNSYITTNGW